MLTLDEASVVAKDHIRQLESSSNTLMEVVKIQEELFGWVFFYQSKEYLRTGEISAMLAGNAPFAVLRKSGEIETFGTARTAEFYVEEMRKKYNG